MSWAEVWPGILGLALIWVLPGYAVLRLLGARGLLAWGAGPAVTSGLSGTLAIGYALVGVSWSLTTLLAGLAVALAFRAGLLNIGAEGQLLAGAGAGAAVGIALGPALGPLAAPAVLAAGAGLGAAWAGIAALLRARRCGGCRMEIDRAEIERIASAPPEEVVHCEECGAILVRTHESGLSGRPAAQ